MKAKQLLLMLMALNLLNSCFKPVSQIRLTDQTTLPILLGNVHKIGGAKLPLGKKKSGFEIYRSNGTVWLQENHPHIQHNDNNVDVDSDRELKNNIVEPVSMVKIEKIYFYSTNIFFSFFGMISLGSSNSSTGIIVSAYDYKNDSHAE